MTTPFDPPPIAAKLFLCAEHGFFYLSPADIKKNVPCPVCKEPMGFESIIP